MRARQQAWVVAGLMALGGCASADARDASRFVGNPGDMDVDGEPMSPDDRPPAPSGDGEWEYRTNALRYGFTPDHRGGATLFLEGTAGDGSQSMTGDTSQGWRSLANEIEVRVQPAEGSCVTYRLIDPSAEAIELRDGVSLSNTATGLSVDCGEVLGTCDPGQVRCQNGACVASEADCGAPSSGCQPGEAACIDGSCIPQDDVCDGFAQCADEEDEQDCDGPEPPPPTGCQPDQFACGNGTCVPESSRCDGEAQCGDGSDEQGCSPAGECTAVEATCGDGSCIPIQWQCDDIIDCPGAEDEQGTWTCANGETISCNFVCDLLPDCTDNSDEQFCG